MTICNSPNDRQIRLNIEQTEKKECGLILQNNRPAGFSLFCSLKRTGSSKERICATMKIDDEKYRRFAADAGIGRYYYRSF